MTKLTPGELTRYQRHFPLKGFGADAQEKLKNAKILVVGAGGLGCPALQILGSSGVGTIGIADHDIVSESNLPRQILYSANDVGKSKVVAARGHLKNTNGWVNVNIYPEKIMTTNATSIVSGYDIIIDCTDSLPTKYLLNDVCVILKKPLVYGAVSGYEGYFAVFNLRIGEEQYSANYRDLYPTPPGVLLQDCSVSGVLNTVTMIIGTMQANEAIKIATGFAAPLFDTLVTYDVRDQTQVKFSVKNRNTLSTIKNLIDYEDFCGINGDKNKSLEHKHSDMKEVTVQDLQKLKQSGEDFQLIDVREPYEYDICNIDGELIPMSDIPNNVDKIAKDKRVVIHCRSGKRSGDMLLWLEKNHGFTNLYNLKGGILAWAKEIDPSMPTY